VAVVVYSRHAFPDLERLADFLARDAPKAAIAAINVIRDGIIFLSDIRWLADHARKG
jgi:plasmid stabilization system protein ParE